MAAGCTLFRSVPAVRADAVAGPDPDANCASCHREIYERYRKTPMAHASGRAIDGLIAADFRHPASGVHYRVYQEAGKVWMSYERDERSQILQTGLPEPGSVPPRELNGRQELRFFLGSGKRGRTYLFQQDGYWFEAPINWYAKKQVWDMTPNHLSDHEMPLTLPVDPGCLHCHASGVASSLPDARNHYAGDPFAYGGIACESCHGDGSAHVASQAKVHMLRLNSLEPVRRDSVCLNCHLEGQTSVDRLGKKPENFRPGDNLFDYAQFFVYRSEVGSGGRATSQWEALLQSECRKKSGDSMTCTTCHDPHGSPSAEERVAFYRQKCLNCHGSSTAGGTGFAASHHPENSDCVACHMARAASTDIAHEQVTDHLIRKRLPRNGTPPSRSGELEAVGGGVAGDRDFGLAYAQLAARGDRQASERALVLLGRVEKEAHGAASDGTLHSELGFLEQVSGRLDSAAGEYERAIQANPFDSLALGDLALIKAGEHRYEEAERLWKAAFDHDPVQVGAGLNLAITECETGNPQAALDSLQRVLEFAPDDSLARSLRDKIRREKQACAGR